MNSRKLPVGGPQATGYIEVDLVLLNEIDGFIATVEAIEKNYFLDPEKMKENSTSLMPAYVVNVTFAIELMFKYESKTHGYELRGHDLLFLYENSDQGFKDKIIDGLVKEGMIISEADFKNKLEEEKRDFEEFRYISETKSDFSVLQEGVFTPTKNISVDTPFIVSLMKIMRKSLTTMNDIKGLQPLTEN